MLAVVEPHSKAELNAMQDELCDGKVGTEGVRWGQAYLCASVVASMERVSSGSLVCSCDLYIGSGEEGGGAGGRICRLSHAYAW